MRPSRYVRHDGDFGCLVGACREVIGGQWKG